MGDSGRFQRDKDSPTQADGGTVVRAPSNAPGIPSSDLPLPSDAPTLVPDSGSDAPTLLPLSEMSPFDAPTLAEGVTPPPLRGGAPTRAARLPQPVMEQGDILAGRYEIQQTLGEGGMGAVYKAKDLALERVVALKVIRPELAENPAIIGRFKQELTAVATGHTPKHDPHLRPGRRRWREVHHHGVHRG